MNIIQVNYNEVYNSKQSDTVALSTNKRLFHNINSSSSNVNGGALFNSTNITNLIADFIGNNVTGSGAYGGAIYNYYGASIGNITGDIIGNNASATGDNGDARGGAIYNSGEIGDITGDIIGNSAKSNTGTAQGGAIYTSSDITIVTTQ